VRGKSGNGNVDNLGIAFRNDGMMEAEAQGSAGPKIVEHNIRRMGKLQRLGAPLLGYEVDRNGAFAAAQKGILGTRLATGGLDFEDVGSLVREQHGRDATGPSAAVIQDADALEWFVFASHVSSRSTAFCRFIIKTYSACLADLLSLLVWDR
jgi:hypothetical protein